MATVNKASLRTEFDALKARFESLCAEGKMPPESRALVDALLMLFELLMAVFMEKHTPKSPANSGLPPSQSPNDATARTPGAKGKGPSYNGAATPAPANTSRCSASVRVAKTSPTPTGRAAPSSTRRSCVTPHPARHSPPRCGPLVVHLLIAQMLSLKRVAQSMHALIGQLLSEATSPPNSITPPRASSHNRRCTSRDARRKNPSRPGKARVREGPAGAKPARPRVRHADVGTRNQALPALKATRPHRERARGGRTRRGR